MQKNNIFYKGFFYMLLTIALQNVLTYGINLADNIMLGKFSEMSMSGSSLVNQIQFLLQMLIGGVGDGIIVIASRFWGASEPEKIKKVSSVGMRVALIFASVMFIAAQLAPENIMRILTDKDVLIAEGTKYLRIVSFSYILFAVTNVLLATLRSVETTRIGFIISLSTLITNITLNYLLIFGNMGAPGSAYAELL